MKFINDTRKVLDHGEVSLLAVHGDDELIAQAARRSYQKGTKTLRSDAELIDYLIRHEHMSPVEMPHMLFYIKAPIFVVRQLFRHRTANVNELSLRYSEMEEEFFTPDSLRKNTLQNRQSSEEGYFTELEEAHFLDLISEHNEESYIKYRRLLEGGVAREQARAVLPVSAYTDLFWQQDLRNLLHLLRLRLSPHAQKEIRDYAEVMAQMVRQYFPATWSAFENHVLNAISLSQDEQGILLSALFENIRPGQIVAVQDSVDKLVENLEVTKGRKREIKEKLKLLLTGEQ